MRKNCLLLLVAGMLVVSVNTHAQSPVKTEALKGYHFRHIDYTNGLANNQVLSITQDKAGFMWISSTKGLQRYDGLRFVKYSNDLATGFYNDDRNHRLWIRTTTKIKPMNLLNNTIDDLPEKSFADKWETYTDWNGKQWNISTNYLATSNKAGNILTGYIIASAPGDTISYSDFMIKFKDRKQTWIVHHYAGFFLLDDSAKKIYAWNYNLQDHPAFKQLSQTKYTPRNAIADAHGNIWFYTWADFFMRYNPVTGELKMFDIIPIIKSQGKPDKPNGWINSMLLDNHGVVWLATANAGLLRYNEKDDKFEYILTQQYNDESIQYNYEIYCLYQDKEENIWIGTDKGISVFNPYRQYFTVLRNEEGNPRSIPKSEITSLIEAPNKDIWVGTWGQGITVFDSLLNFKRVISFPGLYYESLTWCMMQHDDGSIWVGCQEGRIHIIDPITYETQTIRPAAIKGSTVRYMTKDKLGNIWIGLHNGKIVKWDVADKNFYPYGDDSKPLYFVSKVFVDKANNIWATTGDGLKKFDPQKMVYTGSYVPPPNKETNGLHPTGFGIEEFNDSLLIVGFENRGIYFFNKRSNTFSSPWLNEGSVANSVHAIRKDQQGNIWFTTDYELYKFNNETQKLVASNPEKGIINSTFTSPEFYSTRSGKWYTWTDAEVFGFDPARINNDQETGPAINITGFKVFDKPVFIDSLLYYSKPIELNYRQNFIEIEFAALTYSGFQHPEYYYQLEGVDNYWVYAGDKAFASYTGLASGKYTFRVKAENGRNIAPITSFEIVISAPFWKTPWFFILTGVTLGVLSGLFIRWRIHNIRQAAQLKQKIAETEMMALRAQMNPHFIFNCINNIDGLIQSNDKYHATLYLNKFARLIRNILDSSKQNTIPLTRDLETLQLYIDLEKFRSENKFETEIKVDNEVLQEDYRVPPLIIQPYVENAILHGLRNRPDNKGKLLIDVSKQHNYLVYIIEDNGVGRNGSEKSTHQQNGSYGMDMSHDRVKLFNREENASVIVTDLKENGQATGTKVKVSLRIL